MYQYKYAKYQDKYAKYQNKYFKLEPVQHGGSKSIILLDGTSSSGKTTIGKFYEKDGYKLIGIDDFPFDMLQKLIYKDLPLDEYVGAEKITKLISRKARSLMISESKKYSNLKIIFDDINQHLLDQLDRKNIYIIIVYTPLDDLVQNILKRKSTDPRGIFVFTQFAKKYVKTNSIDDSIDVVNRQKFVDSLKKIKYEFESENTLIEFANKIFFSMDISDDIDHYIKLRDTLQYDYIVNTHGKTPDQIYDELKEKTD